MKAKFQLNIFLLLLLAFIPLISSCSHLPSVFSTRDKEYLNAKSIPPLKIPPNIASSTIHNAYPVPYRSYPVSVEDASIVPPGLNN